MVIMSSMIPEEQARRAWKWHLGILIVLPQFISLEKLFVREPHRKKILGLRLANLDGNCKKWAIRYYFEISKSIMLWQECFFHSILILVNLRKETKDYGKIECTKYVRSTNLNFIIFIIFNNISGLSLSLCLVLNTRLMISRQISIFFELDIFPSRLRVRKTWNLPPNKSIL